MPPSRRWSPLAAIRRPGLVRGAALGMVCLGLVLTQAPGADRLATAAAGEIRCSNGDAVLVIDQNPWRLRLLDRDGTERFAEAEAPAFQVGGQWISLGRVDLAESGDPTVARLRVQLGDKMTAMADVRRAGPSGFRVQVRAEAATITAVRGTAALRVVEEIYGFGEMWNGHVAQRGQAFDLWDRGGTPDECAFMPYYVSTNNYALFLNYGGRVRIDVGQHRSDRLVYEATARELDLTLVRGESLPGTVRNFLTEIGLPQRPPRWAFKPWFWLMADPKQPGAKIDTLRGEHFLEMTDKLHELSIPIGLTWFEPPWQDARTTFVPNPEFSRDMPGLVRQLETRGVRTLAWTVPYTTKTASNWKEAVERGYLAAKPGAMTDGGAVKLSATGELDGSYYNAIDFYNPDAVRWWQAQIDRSLDTGIRGYKLDAGQDLEPDARLHGGRLGADVHNSYALEYSRTFFGVLKQRFGGDFLMVPRAAWVGSSAYTNFKWPGDLSGSFGNNGLPSSVYSSLSLAFSGFPFVSTDIGGFDDQPAPEAVWLRWAQFGAMLPGMQTLHMPWWYSPEALTHFRYLTWLHTDLTPLWNTLANEAAATGAPVCRPLVWTFQDDIDCWRVDDEFTVGESLLVAPIINGNPYREVYLPAGEWFDFWDNGESVHGPARVHWFKGWAARDKFPLYVREGAILPLEVTNDFSGFGWAESAGFVTLAIWPKATGASEFTLHDTEAPVRITVARDTDEELLIRWDATQRNHLLRVHLAGGKPPVAVQGPAGVLPRYGSLPEFRRGDDGWFFDAPERKLWVRKRSHGAAVTLSVRFGPATP
ncbi:MAG: glycoside hydrolase family 31 protein [Lacunisphaera sp.]|nr:glycoside hydrolase family 31 protein [Lacunisphaera sp.]